MKEPPPQQPLVTPDACRDEMSAAFDHVEVHSVVHSQHADSADALFDSLVRSMASVVLLRSVLGDRWAAYEPAARVAVRAAAGNGAVEMKLRAWLAVGTARRRAR